MVLRKLLETPEVAVAGRQRARLLTRLEQLKKQRAWGDLTAVDLARRDETRADLSELPDGDRIRVFDWHRARVLALPEAIDVASPAKREELCGSSSSGSSCVIANSTRSNGRPRHGRSSRKVSGSAPKGI